MAGALAHVDCRLERHVPAGDHVLLIACLGINGLLANAVQTSMYALAAHVYPTSVRATGVGYSATLGRLGGLLSSLLGAAIIVASGLYTWHHDRQAEKRAGAAPVVPQSGDPQSGAPQSGTAPAPAAKPGA